MVLGHEVSGEIAEIGSDVEGLSIGQLVAISPSRPCKAREYCLRARLNHCKNMRFYGSAMPFPHIRGAFQQSIVAEVSAMCSGRWFAGRRSGYGRAFIGKLTRSETSG